MNDNTPNAKKIKIKNLLETIIMQICPIYWLMAFSGQYVGNNYIFSSVFIFLESSMLFFFKFLIIALYLDWSSWKNKKKFYLIINLHYFSMILTMGITLISDPVPFTLYYLQIILLIPIMWIILKVIPKCGIKTKQQFFEELDPENLHTESIRYIKIKYIINSIIRISAIGFMSLPIIVYELSSLWDRNIIISIIFYSIYAFIFIFGVSYYYNFILFKSIPIFVQYILYLFLCIGFTYLEYISLRYPEFLLVFSFALIFYLEYKSGKLLFSKNKFDLEMIPIKLKLCSYCKETISEDLMKKVLIEGYIHCPNCQNRILKDELSDFDENHLRKELQGVLKKIADSEELHQ